MNHAPITYREIDSTNAEAARRLGHGSVPEGLVILADYQSGGRGQGGNGWTSAAGKNILMSWIVFPAFLSVQDQFQLSKAVSLAITDFLGTYSIAAKIKWPNDILCDGAKICGILIENSIMGEQLRHSIVGIGLNVRQEAFPAFPWKATSMVLEVQRDGPEEGALQTFNPGSADKLRHTPLRSPAGSFAGDSNVTLATALTASLEARYAQLAAGGSAEISASYLQRLYRLEEQSEFTDGISRFTGVIRGVDAAGQLQLERGGTTRSYGFHEIRMIF